MKKVKYKLNFRYVKKQTLFVLVFFIILIITIEFIPKQTQKIIILPNMSAKQVGKLLKKSKIILDEGIFRWMVFFTNTEKKIKPGIYEISFSLTTLPIIHSFVKGPKPIKVTIPEGFTVEQIAERLYEKNIITDPIQFVTYVKTNNLEGYLFPETYFFAPNQNIKTITDRMLQEFYKNYTSDLAKRAYELKLTTHQVVVLASIIEKEGKSFEEKRIISGVFHNRLKKGWYLESCATVRYALKKFKEPLTYKDLQINSVYNTYKRLGLPPFPICNPGLDSIKAALYPVETDAMFFFTSDNNTHVFSRYYNQHLDRQRKVKNDKKNKN